MTYAHTFKIALAFALSTVGLAQSDGPSTALRSRLLEVNQDIRNKGLLPFAGSTQKVLTGYSYGEFYDWGLYFENVYLSYYGVNEYCFSNLQAFPRQANQTSRKVWWAVAGSNRGPPACKALPVLFFRNTQRTYRSPSQCI